MSVTVPKKTHARIITSSRSFEFWRQHRGTPPLLQLIGLAPPRSPACFSMASPNVAPVSISGLLRRLISTSDIRNHASPWKAYEELIHLNSQPINSFATQPDYAFEGQVRSAAKQHRLRAAGLQHAAAELARLHADLARRTAAAHRILHVLLALARTHARPAAHWAQLERYVRPLARSPCALRVPRCS